MNSGALSDWPRAAASVMVFRGDTVLLGQRAKPPLRGIWSLPGGHIEPGETVAQAAARELHEETGIRVNLLGLAGVRDIIYRDGAGKLLAHYVLTVLMGEWESGTAVAGSDCLAAAWVSLDELENYTLTDGTGQLVQNISDQRRTGGPISPVIDLNSAGLLSDPAG